MLTRNRLTDHLYTLKSGDNSLIEYAMGVTESHDLKEGQWQPDWHCHVIVWARNLVHSESVLDIVGARSHSTQAVVGA
jgi:hypothetical protein